MRPSRSLAVAIASSTMRSAVRALSSRAYPDAPRAAVAVTARRAGAAASAQYALVQRSKPPGEGTWSLPGGAVDVGEATLDAAARELVEETGLVGAWHSHSFTSSDAIYSDNVGRTLFHYLIAQTFCLVDAAAEPVAADDALDARWWTVDEVINAAPGAIGGDVARVLLRSEALFGAGLLPCEEAPR